MREYNLNQVIVQVRSIIDEGNGLFFPAIEVIDDHHECDIIARKELSFETLVDWRKTIKDAEKELGSDQPVELRLSNGTANWWYTRHNDGRVVTFGTSSNPETCDFDACDGNVFIHMHLKDAREILKDGLVAWSSIY